MQDIADDVARRIAALRQPGKPGRVHANLGTIADEVVMDVLVRRAAVLGGDFFRLPIPNCAAGTYGECEGVIVRVMQDYDFQEDRVVTRIDAATAA
jgi:hypothetical protein